MTDSASQSHHRMPTLSPIPRLLRAATTHMKSIYPRIGGMLRMSYKDHKNQLSISYKPFFTTISMG
ncbi:hypothetical protein ACSS6W_007826 [Trichoderma asperelloides]